MKVEKYDCPIKSDLSLKPKEKLEEVNFDIANKFKWCLEYGYNQVESYYPNSVPMTVFKKEVGNYQYSFDVRFLNLELNFNYNGKNLLLEFNGDADAYPHIIQLKYTASIKRFEDLYKAEKKLERVFMNEIYYIFLNGEDDNINLRRKE